MDLKEADLQADPQVDHQVVNTVALPPAAPQDSVVLLPASKEALQVDIPVRTEAPLPACRAVPLEDSECLLLTSRVVLPKAIQVLGLAKTLEISSTKGRILSSSEAI